VQDANMSNEDINNADPSMEGEDTQSTQTDGGPTVADYDKMKAERDMLFERLARAQADFQNSRKRLEAEADQRLQYANSQLIKNLLPTIDNLERAMAVDVSKTDAKSIVAGLKVLVDQLMKVLTVQNVEVIAPNPGDPFDPTKHEALLQQDSEFGPNHVTQLLQKGYALRERTLRPAQVAVSKAH
jgi:molecular chaperone GrpE